MFKRFLRWLTKADRPPKPPLLEAPHASPQGSTPPPPPPPPPARPSEHVAEARPEMPKEKRRLRLIAGAGEEPVTEGDAATDDSTEDLSEGAVDEVPADGEPRVRLVFSDGSSARVVNDSPGGVRIRYLAENLLPPQD